MSVFTPIEGPYSNHIGGGMTHPVTGAVYFLVTWRLPNVSSAPYVIQLWEDTAPYGDPKMIRHWDGAPWGYGTATWLPDGSLYVIAPGNVDNTGKVKPAIHIEPGVFPTIPLGGAHGAPPTPIGPALTDFLSPTSATSMLYDKSYLPTDLDTPSELAVRITKQLFALREQGAAIREIVEALRKQGVLG